ncbi:hypothetical protein [Tateyamaria sp. ANG-S1]|uniref:hypothetical protein n=1 Tax=Tateyamaria sp. ANG-S1 TaxID=1577905 RepID=UPI00057F503C|nr:hypothetical protein [Tateyamaria sp. ANG-S1]KIC51966.1 hypothetical protein RA29_01360 [Tateyamaria sp. ANG-S1]
MRLSLIFLLLTGPAFAQDWALRSTDAPLDGPAVVALVEGNTLTFFDDGQSKFSAGGAYSYTYANGGGTAFGRYVVGDDGTVCIAFRNGFGRCDRYVESNGRVVMLTEKGERFPIRP